MMEALEKAFYAIGDQIVSLGTQERKKFDSKEIRPENVTNEVVVKPRAQSNTREFQSIETRSTLLEKTKLEISDLAIERFGVDLNIRNKKDDLIVEFLEEQDRQRK